MSTSAASTHFSALFARRPVLRPPGRDISYRQRVAVVADRVATLVPDQVDLARSPDGVVPLRPRPDRDRVLQQPPRLRMRTAPELQLRPIGSQPAVHRRRRHRDQRQLRVIGDGHLLEPTQSRHQLRHHRRQPPCPSAPPTPPSRTRAPPQHHCRTAAPEQLAGGSPAASAPTATPSARDHGATSRRAQLIQDQLPRRSIRPPIPRRHRLAHSLPLPHRQSHQPGLPGTARQPPARHAQASISG